MATIAATPKPPYYAVVFTASRTPDQSEEYDQLAIRMVELAMQQPGFLGLEYGAAPDGTELTVSYWESLESIQHWRNHEEHLVAQDQGKSRWYADYHIRITRVEYDYKHPRTSQ